MATASSFEQRWRLGLRQVNATLAHPAKAGEPAAMASSAPAGSASMAPSATPAHHLPKTGSQWPLVGLIGLLSLAGAVSLRQLRARQQ